MRDDIVGMLKNAIEHGGNPARIAQSLINSGYPSKDVQEALSHITNIMPQQDSIQGNPNSPITPRSLNQNSQNISSTQIPNPPQFIRPLPSTKDFKQGTGKLIIMVTILLVLIASLISVIIFKNKILDFVS